MRFYWLREDKTAGYTGETDAVPRWGLPGVHCPACGATWSAEGVLYPAVDLSHLPERARFEDPRPQPIEEFERLREQVRPLVPAGAALPPGAQFGPLVGSARGSFGALYYYFPWTLLMRREALEQLQATGVRGLNGCRTELRFRQKKAPELLELQLALQGRLHPGCLSGERSEPCVRCGGRRLKRPEQPALEAASLPDGLDLFRLSDAPLMMIASERLVEATRRLELPGVAFQQLPTQ